ncbi:hypothetical protein ACQR1N_30950 [Bradyrhizobium sp. HKCCYLRH1073]|uniref:hypothetical protein n=1 Tax=unclassified Bradyrhizobium TaxID=2631580 RepID=UPI003EBFFB91
MSNTSKPKPQRGRPRRNKQMQRVTIWLSVDTLAIADVTVSQQSLVFRDRSDLLRYLIIRGLMVAPAELARERLAQTASN